MMESYTAELANDPTRRRNRTTIQFTLVPRSTLIDRYVLGPLSMFTGLAIASTLMAGICCLIPSILFSKYIMRWPSAFNLPSSVTDDGTNTSNTAVGSLTAIKTLQPRSQMYLQKCGGPDSIAPLLVRHVSQLGPNIPGSKWLDLVYSFMSRWNFYLTGRMFFDQVLESLGEYCKIGEAGMLQVRTCWLDDVVDAFSQRQKCVPFNLVILGAGYDTRCYRLNSVLERDDVSLYEVDAFGSQFHKRRTLDRAGVDSSRVRFVSCDFESQDWMERLLSKSDFDPRLPSLFVWEGMTYYLRRETVISTISAVSTACGKGSCIAFDYFNESCMSGFPRKGAKKCGEPLKFGMDDADKFVRECNSYNMTKVSQAESEVLPLCVLDHLRCDELRRRYIAKRNGRYVGYLNEFGGFLMLGTA